MEIFMECCSRFEVEQMAIFAVLARRIWFRRNAMLFEGKNEHPNQIYREVVTAAADFIDNNSGEESAVEPVRCVVSNTGSWTHPPSGIVKINFDAALNQEKGMVGIGVVARDSMGFLFGAKCFSIHIFTDPHTAEILAATYAVSFSKEVGFFEVIFEGDALNVIKEVNSNPPFLSSVGHLVEGIRNEVGFFRTYSFVHVARGLNEAAHILAKTVITNVVDDVWLEEIPPCILETITRDFQVLSVN
jgi:hypothetical protein